jgi:hypothetical protein
MGGKHPPAQSVTQRYREDRCKHAADAEVVYFTVDDRVGVMRGPVRRELVTHHRCRPIVKPENGFDYAHEIRR